MVKSKGSLIPIRGLVEDWGPGKYQRNLERKEAYARKMAEQVAKGPPDFGRLLAAGVTPVAKPLSKTTRQKASKRTAPSAKKKSSKPIKKASAPLKKKKKKKTKKH